jgi:hypothetical protein
MLTFNEIVTFAYETAYDLSKKKNFSTPKFYITYGDFLFLQFYELFIIYHQT